MSSNYPVLSKSEEDIAPWNQKEPLPKRLEVTISVTLSKTVFIETNQYKTRSDGSIYMEDVDLKGEVNNQVNLPQDKFDDWCIDDFAVNLE